jgi:ribose/xylose/arabinose/galactoside ABC-type transport system permease subunit
MAALANKAADKQQTSSFHYYHELIWRLLAEVPWLVFTFVIAVIMLVRLILLSEGAFGVDQLFKNTIPITMMMGFLLIPMVIIVASGDVDISLGFLAGLVGSMVALLSPMIGLGPAIVISLLISLAVGLINGLLVGLTNLKGIVVTFAMSFLLSGLILLLSEGKTMRAPEGLTPALARSPIIIFLWLLLVILFAALMKFTTLGRRPRAGDPVQETLGTRLLNRGLPFVFSSFMAWISGILVLSWVGYATIASGAGYAEMALLATLLGGTAYYAGTGFVLSGAIALLSIVLFQNGNQLINLSAADQKVIQGVLLLVMLPIAYVYHVGVDGLYHRRKKKSQEGSMVDS